MNVTKFSFLPVGSASAMAWVAMMQHATEGFIKADRPAVIGIVHGVYRGIGVGTGGLTGGALLDLIGAKYTFAVMAGTTVAVTGLFCLAQKVISVHLIGLRNTLTCFIYPTL